MSKFVKSGGGTLIRCLEAINGFKRKYGIWPSHLHVDSGTLYALVNFHLTEEGLERLCGFITVVSKSNINIKATDPDNRTFDYSTEGWPDDPNTDADIESVIFS